MKKLLFVFATLLSFNMASAQFSNNGIGLRLGSGDGFGTEISFQHRLKDVNRIELDLGTNSNNQYSAWSLAGIYQWTYGIDEHLSWFAGAGGRIGSWNENKSHPSDDTGGMVLAAVGNVGLEYSFPIGIQIGLDARPEIGLIHGNILRNSLALSIRYQF